MNSTESFDQHSLQHSLKQDDLLIVKDVKVFFELEHYHGTGLRDVFISAISHPINFFLKTPEIFYALNGVSFELKKGTKLGIIGVNGSGKTTLCRCITGMMTPQSGVIEKKANIRAIFDTGTGVMPELTGRENAYLLARLFFTGTKDLKDTVEEALLFSELGHFIDIPFKKYSKGMQSRLILSIISALPSDILILDEVFDGADIFFREKLAQRMSSLIENTGATIFVSHSLDQIRNICNQVMVLNKGKMVYWGNVEQGINYFIKNHST